MNIRNGFLTVGVLLAIGCGKDQPSAPSNATSAAKTAPEPAKSSTPPLDPNNIASIAIGSPDHTTLVAALKAADYVTSVANAGPLTVFAPTNAAFDKLPAGTVDGLLEPGRIDDLKNVLKYHVSTSVYDVNNLKDGEMLAMANGAKVEIHIVDGAMTVNGANVVASIRASNGIVHVIDGVLLPPSK